MSIKDDVRKKSMEMMSDPRVMKLMQNPQFMKVMMAVVQVPGKVNTFTNEQADRLAKSLKLATAEDLQNLKRSVNKLEAQVEQLREKVERRDD